MGRSKVISQDLSAYGRHFIIGLQPQPRLTEHDRELLSALRPAGVILFRRNFRHDASYDVWLEEHRLLIQDVRDCIRRDDLLIAIDHEGGLIVRPPPPITAYVPAASWADRAAQVARAMAIELKSLGVNVSFAPVVDIDSNPSNPVIGERAFGRDAESVIAASLEFLRGMKAEGVIACAKHYPGHGDTNTDSHHDLPVLDLDLAALKERELKPFAAMAAAGAPMIMTAHIMFPKIDPDRPATFSPKLINDLLRGDYGYNGVVVSDDIGMKAVSKLYDRPDAGPLTLTAGCDMIMVCAYQTDTKRALRIAQHIDEARQADPTLAEVLAQSGARVDTLLTQAVNHPVTRLPSDVLAAHAVLAPLREDRLAKASDDTGGTCAIIRSV